MVTDLKRTPFTLALLVSLLGAALAGWLSQGATVRMLALTDPGARPWGLLTYPWAFVPALTPLGLLFLVFFAMWLVQFGGSVERDLGTARFAGFWAVFTLLFAVIALGFAFSLSEPWLPTSAIVVAWCARNRGARVAFWGIPISTPIFAAIATGLVLLSYGSANPALGVLMALPLALAWAFGGDHLPLRYGAGGFARREATAVRGAKAYDESYFEDVKKREIEREERERLRKLFEGE